MASCLHLCLFLVFAISSQSAPVPDCYYAGKVIKAGETFYLAEIFQHKCDASGVTCTGCSIKDNDLPGNAIFLEPPSHDKEIGSFTYTCYKSGNQLYYTKSAIQK